MHCWNVNEKVIPESTNPPNVNSGVIFLGIAERAAYVHDGNVNLFKWNVLGLKTVLGSFVYPFAFSDFFMGLAFSPVNPIGDRKLRLVDEQENEVGFINLSTKTGSPSDPEANLGKPLIMIPINNWSTAFLKIENSGFVIQKPGSYKMKCIVNSKENIIGELEFVLFEPVPLTEERIAAIKSNPKSAKIVRAELACKICSDKIKTYAALEKNEKLEGEGFVWYKNLSEKFICSCGKTEIILETHRNNLHGLLGAVVQKNENINLVPLYERGVLESIRTKFSNLLQSIPTEEQLQQFIKENPILLHQFPSVRLFSKPPIMNFFADFAILTPNKELILIELEKTRTRLLKRDGGIASELSHAFDQVRDWLHITDEHRLAILEALKIEKSEVSKIRGVVIAGRDIKNDAHHLRKLKGGDYGPIGFLTYDDLLFALDALITQIIEL